MSDDKELVRELREAAAYYARDRDTIFKAADVIERLTEWKRKQQVDWPAEIERRNRELTAAGVKIERLMSESERDAWKPIETKTPFLPCEERGVYTENGNGLFFFKATHWR